MQLENTAALVTGAASGLGSATATALAAQGVQVFDWIWPAAGRRAATPPKASPPCTAT